ncbi:tetratricopeptide repeat protein [Rhodobacterales bacterium HKCCE2091]|nr:tetratricopeptide repeat protein [Rhodobacterales bacterium HKCCE2091]
MGPKLGVVLQGGGGQGKTTLARHYAEQSGLRGAWIPAQSREGILDALARFGNTAFGMDLPSEAKETHAGVVLDRIRQAKRPALFVFDNVEDAKLVRSFIPQGPRVEVILTTRPSGDFSDFETMRVGVLPSGDLTSPAVQLLLQEAGAQAAGHSRQDALELAQALGGLPLALIIAGAMAKQGQSFDNLRREIALLIEQEPNRSEAYPDSVGAAVRLSYEALSDDAKWVADVCAWFAPEGLEERLFTDAPDGDWWHLRSDEIPERWQGFLRDPVRVRAAFAELRGLSILRGEAGAGQAMHRLTAAVLRLGQPGEGQATARAAAALLDSVYPGGSRTPENPDTWPECQRLTPHAVSVWEKAEGLWRGTWSQPGWAAMDTLLNQAGVFLSVQEDRAGEIAVGRASLELKRARLGEEAREVPVVMGNLGLALSEVGEFTEAEDLLDGALALNVKHRAKSADRVESQVHRAILEIRRHEAGPKSDKPGDLDATADWLIEAEAVAADLPEGKAANSQASCWNQLSYLRRLKGDAKASAEAAERALDLSRAGGAHRGEIAAVAMNVGAVWLKAGKADKAEELLREAYEIRAEIHADTPGHSKRQNAAGWYASCLIVLEKTPEARQIVDIEGLDWAERVRIAAQYPRPDRT